VTCRGVLTFKCFCGYQLSSFSLAVSRPQNPFTFEKVCQGEDDCLINHILSVSPSDNTKKCVHGLLLHQAAVVIHSTSAGTGRAEKPSPTAEMWRRAPFPRVFFTRRLPHRLSTGEGLPCAAPRSLPSVYLPEEEVLVVGVSHSKHVCRNVCFLNLVAAGSCQLTGGLAGCQSLSGATRSH